MITVSRYDGGVSIKGHAGYAPHGQDVVCAAVSALVQGFYLSVMELTHDKIKAEMKPGEAVIQYGDLSKEATLLVSSLFVGLKMIADEFPDCVRVE